MNSINFTEFHGRFLADGEEPNWSGYESGVAPPQPPAGLAKQNILIFIFDHMQSATYTNYLL